MVMGELREVLATRVPDPRTIDRNDFGWRRPLPPRTPMDMPSLMRGCRSALEAGADPVVVAGWIKEVEADRLHAERELASTTSVVQLF